MDETYARVASGWMYLFRAVDNRGQTADRYWPWLAVQLSNTATVAFPSGAADSCPSAIIMASHLKKMYSTLFSRPCQRHRRV
jgi:transposase-like protein